MLWYLVRWITWVQVLAQVKFSLINGEHPNRNGQRSGRNLIIQYKNIVYSQRTVKSNLNSYINRNKLYKDKFYIVKKEISPATTEYENAVINSEATV